MLRKKFKVVKKFAHEEKTFIFKEIYPTLTNKEKAFLLYLSFKLNEPGKKIEVSEIIDNFFKEKKNPNYLFSKYLYKIKKELKISALQIEVKNKHTQPELVNNGIYLISDYDIFEKLITQAKYFMQINEWGKSKKFLFSALRIFRNPPFEKMYDEWSDFMRMKMLNKYKKEIIYFAEECKKRKDYETLYKISKISKRILSSIGYNENEEK